MALEAGMLAEKEAIMTGNNREHVVRTSTPPCEKCARLWQESSINDTVMLSKTFYIARVDMMVQALLPFRPSIWTVLSKQATCFHICSKGIR